MEDQSRRRMMKSAGLIGGLGVIPAVSSADDSSQEFKIESLEREELVSADSYTVYRYQINRETMYLKVLEEEKRMQILQPDDVSEAQRQDVSKLVRSQDWKDEVVRFRRVDGKTNERCSALDDYGLHQYGLAAAEFNSLLSTLNGATIGAVVDALLEPLGIPSLSSVVESLVTALGALASYEAAVAGVDGDVPYLGPGVEPRFSRNYNDRVGDLTGTVTIPSVHIAE